MELFNAPLRYRFDHLDQARAHVVRAGDHSLFFFRHPRLSLEPGSSVQMEWTVQIAWSGRVERGRLLDVSAGGARISGAPGILRGDLVELRLPSEEEPALFHELGSAYVA